MPGHSLILVRSKAGMRNKKYMAAIAAFAASRLASFRRAVVVSLSRSYASWLSCIFNRFVCPPGSDEQPGNPQQCSDRHANQVGVVAPDLPPLSGCVTTGWHFVRGLLKRKHCRQA